MKNEFTDMPRNIAALMVGGLGMLFLLWQAHALNSSTAGFVAVGMMIFYMVYLKDIENSEIDIPEAKREAYRLGLRMQHSRRHEFTNVGTISVEPNAKETDDGKHIVVALNLNQVPIRYFIFWFHKAKSNNHIRVFNQYSSDSWEVREHGE